MRGGADGGGCFPTGQHYPGIAHLLRVKHQNVGGPAFRQAPASKPVEPDCGSREP